MNNAANEARNAVEAAQAAKVVSYKEALDVVADNVKNVLSEVPTISKKQVDDVVYKIQRAKYEVWNSPEELAASIKAALYDEDGTMTKAWQLTKTYPIDYSEDAISQQTNIELAAQIESTFDGTYTSDNANGYMAARYYQGTKIEKIIA